MIIKCMFCSSDCYVFCDNCGILDEVTASHHYDRDYKCGPPKEMCNRCWTIIGVKSFPIFVEFRRQVKEHGSMLTYDRFLALWKQQRTIYDDPLYPINMCLPTVVQMQSTFPEICSTHKILNSVCACNEFLPSVQDIMTGFVYHTELKGLPMVENATYSSVSFANAMVSLPEHVLLPIESSFLKFRVIDIASNRTYDVEADADQIVDMILDNENSTLQSMDGDYELPDLV